MMLHLSVKRPPEPSTGAVALEPADVVLIHGSSPVLSPDEEAKIRPAVREVQAWSDLVERAFRHRVAEAMYSNLSRLDLLGSCSARWRGALERAFLINDLVISLLAEEEESLAGEIRRHGLKVALLDAPSLTMATYPEASPRHHESLELCVDNDRDFRLLDRCVVGLGYRSGVFDQRLWRIVGLAPHYVKNPIGVYHKPVRVTQLPRHVTSVYNGIALGSFALHLRIRKTLVLSRSRSEPRGDTHVPSQALAAYANRRLEDTIALLCMRAYWDILVGRERQLRYLFDVAAPIARFDGHVHWPTVYQSAQQCGTTAPLFYVLGQIQQILGLRIPHSFLEKIACSAEFHNSDLGDFLPFLLDKPFVPAVDFEE